MQRIPTLLKKIAELAEKGDSNSTIDIDLMLDYTKVVYADLLEWRSRKTFVSSIDANGGTTNNEWAQAAAESKKEEAPIVHVKEEVAEEPAPVAETITEAAPVIEFVVNTPEAKPKADIRQSIGINDKYLFMSELFGNNRDDYEQALDKINGFGSYAEAEEWLNDYIAIPQGNTEDNDTREAFRSVLIMFYNTK